MIKLSLTLAPKHQTVKAVIVAALVLICGFIIGFGAAADEKVSADWAEQAVARWMAGDQTDGRDKVVAAGYALHQRALQDDPHAQFTFAQLLEAGLPRLGGGLATRHPAQAMGWYMRAARLGHEGALARLKQLVGPHFEAPEPTAEPEWEMSPELETESVSQTATMPEVAPETAAQED